MKVNILQQLWNTAAAGPVGSMERFEAAFSPPEFSGNPYDPEQADFQAFVCTPEGLKETVFGFWYEGYSRILRQGMEILLPGREREWRFRYSPRKAGQYQYYVTLKLPNENYRWPVAGMASFQAIESGKHGFLRVSGADTDLLEFSDGHPFWGIGHNLCGWEWGGTDNRGGTYDYDCWMQKMAENGANMTQFHFGEGNQLEWTPLPGELPWSHEWKGLGWYNQQTAWKMDARVTRAEELGLFFRLSLLHWEDFDNETERFPDWGWSRNPYHRNNGGPVADVSDFFLSEAARCFLRKLLRYVAARWGASPNLLAYELWNEIDAPEVCWREGETYLSQKNTVLAWHREMAGYLKAIDSRHLVTTSYADSRLDDALWSLPEIDLTTVHRYTYFNPDYGDGQYDTESALLRIAQERRSRFRKPVLFGEFALSPGGDIQKDCDRSGVEFQNQIWCSLAAKALGTAMHWTWGSYLDEYGLYGKYAPLADFLQDEDLRGMSPYRVNGDGQKLVCLGLQSGGRALLWIKNKAFTFEHPAPTATRESMLLLPGFADGEYVVELLDPMGGGQKVQLLRAEQEQLPILVPAVAAYIAVKINPVSAAWFWASRDLPKQRLGSATRFQGLTAEVRGGGGGFGPEGDAFRLVSQAQAGDFCLCAKISLPTKTGESARAGLIARAGFNENADFIALLLNPYGQAELVSRYSGRMEKQDVDGEHLFIWFSLMRKGKMLAARISTDGERWQNVGEQTGSFAESELEVGLTVFSGDSFRYADACFTNISSNGVIKACCGSENCVLPGVDEMT